MKIDCKTKFNPDTNYKDSLFLKKLIHLILILKNKRIEKETLSKLFHCLNELEKIFLSFLSNVIPSIIKFIPFPFSHQQNPSSRISWTKLVFPF